MNKSKEKPEYKPKKLPPKTHPVLELAIRQEEERIMKGEVTKEGAGFGDQPKHTQLLKHITAFRKPISNCIKAANQISVALNDIHQILIRMENELLKK